MKESEVTYDNISIDVLQNVVDSSNPHWGKIILLCDSMFTYEDQEQERIEDESAPLSPGQFWISYSIYFQDGVMRRYSPSSERIPGLSCTFYDKYRWFNQKTRRVITTTAIEIAKDVAPICTEKGGVLYYK